MKGSFGFLYLVLMTRGHAPIMMSARNWLGLLALKSSGIRSHASALLPRYDVLLKSMFYELLIQCRVKYVFTLFSAIVENYSR